MALPDYVKIEPGTAIVLGEAGASGVTHTLSLNNLASGSARMSAVVDFGSSWDEEFAVIAAMESGTAPTAGGSIDVYCACTHSTSYYPAGVTGSDGAWPGDGNEDEHARNLGEPVTSVIAVNDANTLVIAAARLFRPAARYGVVVVDNNWDQGVRNETTPTDNDSRVILVPRKFVITD